MTPISRLIKHIETRKALLLNDAHNTDLPHWKQAYNLAWAELDSMARLAQQMVELDKDYKKKVK